MVMMSNCNNTHGEIETGLIFVVTTSVYLTVNFLVPPKSFFMLCSIITKLALTRIKFDSNL